MPVKVSLLWRSDEGYPGPFNIWIISAFSLFSKILGKFIWAGGRTRPRSGYFMVTKWVQALPALPKTHYVQQRFVSMAAWCWAASAPPEIIGLSEKSRTCQGKSNDLPSKFQNPVVASCIWEQRSENEVTRLTTPLTWPGCSFAVRTDTFSVNVHHRGGTWSGQG